MKIISKKKKCLIRIISLLILISLVVFLVIINTRKRYNYTDIPGGIQVINENNMISLAYDFPVDMEIDFMGAQGMEELYKDPETGYPCYRQFFYFNASPFAVAFKSYYHKSFNLSYTTDGWPVGSTEDPRGRIVELCYLNEDGSYITLWKRGY